MSIRRRTGTNSGLGPSSRNLSGITETAVPESDERNGGEASVFATVLPPNDGKLYHGVFASRAENEPSPGGKCEAEWYAEEYPRRYLSQARPFVPEQQRGLAWFLFGNNWRDESCRRFPMETCRWIWDLPDDGSHVVPYLYLFTKSIERRFEPDPRYYLLDIIDGKFDDEFRSWARGAREFGHPLMVAWGAECNGYWHSWNGMYNGIDKLRRGQAGHFEGPARFVDAYRHIINVMDSEGATNVNWIFEVAGHDNPNTSNQFHDWNSFELYYPGDDYITWVAVSIYGEQSGELILPEDEAAVSFNAQFEQFHSRLTAMKDAGAMARDKPLIVGEFGCCAASRQNPDVTQDEQAAKWAGAALTEMFSGKASGKYPDLIGFSWWNEAWTNGEQEPDTEMRIQEIPSLGSTFATLLRERESLLQERMNTASNHG